MKAPEYKRQVSDSGPERFRQQAPSAAGFARAAAVTAEGAASLGRALAGAGDAAFKISEENDKRTAAAAVNDYIERCNAYLYDPDRGYRRAQGEGVRGLAGRVGEDMGRMRSEVAGRLSRNQAKLFEEAVRDFDIGVNRQVSVYEGETMAAWHKDQGERLAANGAVAWANDPGMSPEALSAAFIMPATIAVFGDQGAEVNFKNAQTVMSTMIAKTALLKAESDPLAAEAFFAEHMSDMEPAEAEALRLKIEKAALPVKAQAEAQELLAKHGVDGLSSALAEAREAHDGKDEDVYLGCVNSLFADARAERDARREVVKEGFYGVYNRKGSFSAARDFINRNKDVLGEAGYASFMDMAQRMWEVGKYAPKPDKPVKKVMSRDEMIEFQRVFNDGKKFVLSGSVSTPGQMAAFNDRYGEALRSLSGDDRAFQDLLELTAPKAGGTDDKRGLYSANEMVSKRAEDAGILRSYEAYRDFDAEWLKACEKRAVDEGRPLTKDEMVTEGDRLIEEKVILGRDGCFSGGPLKAPEYQFRRLGISAEDVHWNPKTREYFIERENGDIFLLKPDKDFYKLEPLRGDKRNFAPAK